MGTVILKRLEDAIADNDIIHGVAPGTLTNHCGRTDSITRPFDGDQASLFNIIRSTGIDPLDVTYVESTEHLLIAGSPKAPPNMS